MIKEATKIIIVCVVRRVSCGDRTTTTESELSVHTVNIGASVCIQYGHTPYLLIINSMNNRWINHNHSVALLFVCRAENRNGERERDRGERSKAPIQKDRTCTVILNAFPLLTVDKKLSLEVTSKLERLEYSYKCCMGKEDTMVGVCLFWRSPRSLQMRCTRQKDMI